MGRIRGCVFWLSAGENCVAKPRATGKIWPGQAHHPNLRKIVGVQHNARFILDVVAEHGSFGTFISHWPQEDLIGLFAHLKKHGSRLGGMTGQRVLRNMGRDTFVITGDVTRALRGAGLDIKEAPTSQRELRLIQNKFNEWHQSSGLPYSHVSKICAYSV